MVGRRLVAGLAAAGLLTGAGLAIGGSSANAAMPAQALPSGCIWNDFPWSWTSGIAGYCATDQGLMWFGFYGEYGYY